MVWAKNADGPIDSTTALLLILIAPKIAAAQGFGKGRGRSNA